MPSDGTTGGLVGELDVLRIECPTCDWQGRYQVAHLLVERGVSRPITDWLNERTADCSQKEPRRSDASMRRGHAGFGRSSVGTAMKEIVVVCLATDAKTGAGSRPSGSATAGSSASASPA